MKEDARKRRERRENMLKNRPLFRSSMTWMQAPSALDDDFSDRVYSEAVNITLENWSNTAYQILLDANAQDSETASLEERNQQPVKLKLARFVRREISSLRRYIEEDRDIYETLCLMLRVFFWVTQLERLHQAELVKYESYSVDPEVMTQLEAADRQQRGLKEYNAQQKTQKESSAHEARELRDKGYTHLAIATAMNISEKTVSRYLKEKK